MNTLKVVGTIVGIIVGLFMLVQILDGRYVAKGQMTITKDLPIGTILAWHVKEGVVPDGWMVCDGSNGTPDLRNRFLLGTANLADVGNTGGNKSFTIPERSVKAYANGWDSILTEHPNGGPEEGQDWRSRRWHRLLSDVTVPSVEIPTVPPFASILFIMKVE